MSEPLPLFPETYGFVPLFEKVHTAVLDDMARVEASESGVLAESRFLPRDALTSAWQRAPGETVTGRVTDVRA